MAWNPETYNKFKSERAAPFYDAMHMITVRSGLKVIDLGCGTGALTKELHQYLPLSEVLGIDQSASMLKEHKSLESKDLNFRIIDIQSQLNTAETYDLVFSNAVLQWLPDHAGLIPQIIKLVRPGGQLVVQMPCQSENITNLLLDQLASTSPFDTIFEGWTRGTSVVEMDQYADILFSNHGRNINVFKKIYPIIFQDTDQLFDWVSGTAIIPYLEILEGDQQQEFISAYRLLLKSHFTDSTIFYPFKRIFFSATF